MLGVVYGIYQDGALSYVGSTTSSLELRMARHRTKMLERPGRKLYKTMAEIGPEHFTIAPLCEVTFDTCAQLRAKEGELIRFHNTVKEGLNVRMAGRCRSQYRIDEHERIRTYKREYMRRWRAGLRATSALASHI